MQRSLPSTFAAALIVSLLASPAAAQLSNGWVVAAAANTPGVGGTFWRSDVSIHNPHDFELPVVVQALESDRANWSAPTLDLLLSPYETVNLWHALGEDVFALAGTAAIIAYADPALLCDPIESCDFLVTSRTYTVDPAGGAGEYGQSIRGQSVEGGVDWWTLGYASGVLNDGVTFRCNVGVASWTDAWTTMRLDVQDGPGTILATEELVIPPFGHVQRRLQTPVEGGTLVFYLVDGPDDALVFPYASVVDERTGDPSFVAALPSVVGASVSKAASRKRPERHPEAAVTVPAGDALRRRQRAFSGH
jgi:hypothetical protein